MSVVLSAHQWQMREQWAHARTRRRDHPDRHERSAPGFIRFVHEHVPHTRGFERASDSDHLVERRGKRHSDGGRRRIARICELRRPSGGMNRLRELNPDGRVSADDDVVGDPTASAVNAWSLR
jgi:hypothetical protein